MSGNLKHKIVMNNIEMKFKQVEYELNLLECTDLHAKTGVRTRLEELSDLVNKRSDLKVVFSTNIDNYNSRRPFPTNYTFVPRKGESVSVTETFISYYRNKHLPTQLEVVGVTYYENRVVCELHYHKIDVETAKLCGINLFG